LGEAPLASEFYLLGEFQSVVTLNTEIANRNLKLAMTQQQRANTQVAPFLVDQ
jgi:hypothetical protein